MLTYFRMLIECKDAPYPGYLIEKALDVPYRVSKGDTVDLSGNGTFCPVIDVAIDLANACVVALVEAYDAHTQADVGVIKDVFMAEGWAVVPVS